MSIHISARPIFWEQNPFWIDIYRTKDNIKIVYSIQTGKRQDLLNADKDYASFQQVILNLPNADSVQKTWYRLHIDSIYNQYELIQRKYAICDKDSLLLDRQNVASYDGLLNRINLADTAELENRPHGRSRNLGDDRPVLDGEDFEFTINAISGTKKVQAHSPDPSWKPLLYSLLTETLSIYRDTKNNTFLDKQKTFGY